MRIGGGTPIVLPMSGIVSDVFGYAHARDQYPMGLARTAAEIEKLDVRTFGIQPIKDGPHRERRRRRHGGPGRRRGRGGRLITRSEEHTSELQSHSFISYAV